MDAETRPSSKRLDRSGSEHRLLPDVVESLPLGIDAASTVVKALDSIIRFNRAIGPAKIHPRTVVAAGERSRIGESGYGGKRLVLRHPLSGNRMMGIAPRHEDPTGVLLGFCERSKAQCAQHGRQHRYKFLPHGS